MTRIRNFNSIKVRLKHLQGLDRHQCHADFNSIKVRLKHSLFLQRLEGLQHFNSIKVRLKRAARYASFHLIKFQFHKGTIKTYQNQKIVQQLGTFQFHKGTIKTLGLTLAIFTFAFDFNSIKVRLKLVCYPSRSYCWIFQFHKGTIKTTLRSEFIIVICISIP